MKEISRRDYTKKHSLKALKNLNALLNAIDGERKINYETIKIIRDICVVIPHTPEIYIKAKIKDLSSKPPSQSYTMRASDDESDGYKFNDCQIYYSVLDFASKSKGNDKIIFLTKDIFNLTSFTPFGYLFRSFPLSVQFRYAPTIGFAITRDISSQARKRLALCDRITHKSSYDSEMC